MKYPLPTDDLAFLASVEDATVSAFGHVEHLRMAYAFRHRDGTGLLEANCCAAIRRLAVAGGNPAKFRATRTVAWARLVAAAVATNPHTTFAGLLDAEPRLRRKDLLSDFYSAALLTSDTARERFVQPDRRALP